MILTISVSAWFAGNTWNHEHIALLGMALTSPIKEGHEIAKHLADYVLVWAGGGGDDLAKVGRLDLIFPITSEFSASFSQMHVYASLYRAHTWQELQIRYIESTALMTRLAAISVFW